MLLASLSPLRELLPLSGDMHPNRAPTVANHKAVSPRARPRAKLHESDPVSSVDHTGPGHTGSDASEAVCLPVTSEGDATKAKAGRCTPAKAITKESKKKNMNLYLRDINKIELRSIMERFDLHMDDIHQRPKAIAKYAYPKDGSSVEVRFNKCIDGKTENLYIGSFKPPAVGIAAITIFFKMASSPDYRARLMTTITSSKFMESFNGEIRDEPKRIVNNAYYLSTLSTEKKLEIQKFIGEIVCNPQVPRVIRAGSG